MIKVFWENTWEEIITSRGFKLFEDRGIFSYGNLFRGKRRKSLPSASNVDFFIATDPSMEAVKLANQNNKPVIFYSLFPDQVIGWDYQKGHYHYNPSQSFLSNINKCLLLVVNSVFTKKLLRKTYQNRKLPDIELNYLGIDTKSIFQAEPLLNENNKTVRVLWNHMWRTEKGFPKALNIIYHLAQNFPEVSFYIGREERWGGNKVADAKQAYSKFKTKLEEEKIENIFITPTHDSQKKYWSYLKSMDIGFSCSLHETFGLSMLEQAAAHMACVVPDTEVYPEVHQGAIKVRSSEIDDVIGELILDAEKRCKVADRCQSRAQSFMIDNFVAGLSQVIINNKII